MYDIFINAVKCIDIGQLWTPSLQPIAETTGGPNVP